MMKPWNRMLFGLCASSARGLAAAAAPAEEPELSLRDLIRVIDRVNQDLPKTLENKVVFERAVQGSGRHMIFIYTVPYRSDDMGDKERTKMRAGLLKNMCTGFEAFTKD